MTRTGPRGPNWTHYGPGTVVFHLTSGQSIHVKVASFKYRYWEGDRYEWVPEGPDTLPVAPAANLVVAIEHHPAPRPNGNVSTTADQPIDEDLRRAIAETQRRAIERAS